MGGTLPRLHLGGCNFRRCAGVCFADETGHLQKEKGEHQEKRVDIIDGVGWNKPCAAMDRGQRHWTTTDRACGVFESRPFSP